MYVIFIKASVFLYRMFLNINCYKFKIYYIYNSFKISLQRKNII